VSGEDCEARTFDPPRCVLRLSLRPAADDRRRKWKRTGEHGRALSRKKIRSPFPSRAAIVAATREDVRLIPDAAGLTVGIELKGLLMPRKLLIPRRAQTAQIRKLSKAGCTAGTRPLEDPIEVERFLLVSQ
jgi:hypothetical protein